MPGGTELGSASASGPAGFKMFSRPNDAGGERSDEETSKSPPVVAATTEAVERPQRKRCAIANSPLILVFWFVNITSADWLYFFKNWKPLDR